MRTKTHGDQSSADKKGFITWSIMKRKKAEAPLVPSPLRRRSRWNLSYLISFCILLSSWCPVFDQHTRKHAERLKSLYVPRVQEEAGEATVVPGWPVPMFASTWCWTVGRYHIHTHKFIDQYVIVEAAGCRQASCVLKSGSENNSYSSEIKFIWEKIVHILSR